MKRPTPATIDFETFGIDGRPDYPPIPVGVSIKMPNKKTQYYAFGHLNGNNCCWSDAKKAVEEAYKCKDGILFQNAKFDVDVAETWFDISIPSWDKIHDTMFLLFLHDPHQKELGLKEAAERLLDIPAEEQDAIGKWLIENQPVPGIKITAAKNSDHYFGRYINFAPGKLVGKYANGDVNRTWDLFKLLWADIKKRDMLEPYDRERKLMPILLHMERQGVQTDLKRLSNDVTLYNQWREKVDTWIIRKLKCSPDINLNSGAQLVEAMITAGIADPDKMPLTPTGRIQTNKEALLLGVSNKQFLSVMNYRTQLNTCLNTFMIPWLKVAQRSKGLIFTHWNQVKAPKGGDNAGTRTGRLSSTPNFQNIPNTFKPLFKSKGVGKLPTKPFKDLPPLPKVRSYIIPFKGHVLIDRDYSQQEPRILGHFDGGAILEKYQENPWIDFHDSAKEELEHQGKFYDRKPVKNTNLGIIYGMGVGKLAIRNNMSVEESSALKKAILLLYPGIKDMYKEMKYRAKMNQPIRTWGGREYYCEPPKLINGRLQEFDYKMVNVLVQGSAADCTKEAIIRLWDLIVYFGKVKTWKIILNVHDQITESVPKRELHKAMQVLQEAMESIEFDVPMLSEGSYSDTHWDELKDYDVKGVRV